jgi:very-short-patch-repair endonuclease
MRNIYRKPKHWRGIPSTIAIGDPSPTQTGKIRRGPRETQKFARARRGAPTAAEAALEQILSTVNNGALKGKFQREWAFCNWILDFFFVENRLGIEVDGRYHSSPRQKTKDAEKEIACRRFDVTLFRLTNEDVFGNRELLLEKLRDAYRRANQHMKTLRDGRRKI